MSDRNGHTHETLSRTHGDALLEWRRLLDALGADVIGAGALVQLQQHQRTHVQKHGGRDLGVGISALEGLVDLAVGIVVVVFVLVVVVASNVTVAPVADTRRLLLLLVQRRSTFGVSLVFDGHVEQCDGR